MSTKKGIIFDMDGVLIDAMPFHAEAMSRVIKEMTDHEIDKKNIYLLEGMSGSDLVKELFKRESIDSRVGVNDEIAKQIGTRKEEVFKQIQDAKEIDGVKELLEDLTAECGKSCIKAVVSGSTREEVEAILDKNIGVKYFDLIIAGDDLEKGKPNPTPFIFALNKMDLDASQVIVVENSPLGVEAANKAGLKYIITLNNTPLNIHSDFKGLIPSDPEKITFDNTRSASKFLKKWCCE
jgi:beta-phosphoglucomutase-like phosphatase (HAD superfamily)